jgi:hypothetical protein
MVGFQNLWLILLPPLTAPSEQMFQNEFFSMNTHLQGAVPLLILGGLGAAITIYRRKWLGLYPFVWAAIAYGLFSFYSPVFYHHQLLITVPMAMMAAAGIGDGISSLWSLRRPSDLARFQTVFGIITLVVFIRVSTIYARELDRDLLNRPDIYGSELEATAGKLKVLNLLNEHIDQTNWIVTDVPIFAFRVNRPVPPVLATFSSKRLATGSLTEEDIMAAMLEYQPEQVVMARFKIPALEEYLQEHYTLIGSPEYYRVFLRNDLILDSE